MPNGMAGGTAGEGRCGGAALFAGNACAKAGQVVRVWQAVRTRQARAVCAAERVKACVVGRQQVAGRNPQAQRGARAGAARKRLDPPKRRMAEGAHASLLARVYAATPQSARRCLFTRRTPRHGVRGGEPRRAAQV